MTITELERDLHESMARLKAAHSQALDQHREHGVSRVLRHVDEGIVALEQAVDALAQIAELATAR